MLDYSHYTGDSSYDEVITQALLSQVGPKFDFMQPLHFGSEGNDDQAFWSFAVLEAAERNFPQPNDTIPPWLDIAENIWNTMAPRWNESHCGGGLAWQIFESNPNGMSYKNSVSNGGFFQLSARLARATGNDTYRQLAEQAALAVAAGVSGSSVYSERERMLTLYPQLAGPHPRYSWAVSLAQRFLCQQLRCAFLLFFVCFALLSQRWPLFPRRGVEELTATSST